MNSSTWVPRSALTFGSHRVFHCQHGPLGVLWLAGGALLEIELVQPATMILQRRIYDRFLRWLDGKLSRATMQSVRDHPQLQVNFLRTFGNELYRAGDAMYLFRHLMVFLQQTFPSEKPRITPAWELLARWEAVQPVEHRPPMPKVLLDAILATALSWG